MSIKCTSIIFGLLMTMFVYCCSCEGRDFYKILGVESDASDHDIKSSFRKLAVKMHPDKNLDDPDASRKFQDLREAFEVLSDSKKRKIYDHGGEDALKKAADDPFGFSNNAESLGFLFEQIFGLGGRDFGFQNQEQNEPDKRPHKGMTLRMDVHVTYEEFYRGKVIRLERIKPVYVEAKGTRQCKCREETVIQRDIHDRVFLSEQMVCETCPNKILSTKDKTLLIRVLPGMMDGINMIFKGEGEPHIDGEPGDFRLKLVPIPHDTFTRDGDDLHTILRITLLEALTGFNLYLKHLDGRLVSVSRTEVSWPGLKIIRRGDGMPVFKENRKGDLHITIMVEFPRGELQYNHKMILSDVLKGYVGDGRIVDDTSAGNTNRRFFSSQ